MITQPRREEVLRIRISERERAIFEELATRHGLSVSSYVRNLVLNQKLELERQAVAA